MKLTNMAAQLAFEQLLILVGWVVHPERDQKYPPLSTKRTSCINFLTDNEQGSNGVALNKLVSPSASRRLSPNQSLKSKGRSACCAIRTLYNYIFLLCTVVIILYSSETPPMIMGMIKKVHFHSTTPIRIV